MWQHHIFEDTLITIPIDVKEGIYKASKGIIDQVIKIFIQMEIEYLQAQIKPQVDGEFVYKIVNKYYPGTILHLKKKDCELSHK
ncbi:MAG: hypothetical protein IKY26_06030 [Erysipelotrichaceae bacterium]|nr:hypothetical protein [Erysipelotrichaceae bacterium]